MPESRGEYNRTSVYRQVHETIERIEADLGGADRLTTAQRAIVKHGVLASVWADHHASQWLAGGNIEPAAFNALANTARRSFETVGLERLPTDVTPSLSNYLASKATTEADERPHRVKTPYFVCTTIPVFTVNLAMSRLSLLSGSSL